MQTELLAHGIRRVQVWQRAVDTELFHAEQGSRDMRERLTEGHPDEKLLLYVGRLSAEKNIEQCRFVLETLPGVRLALVGDGPHRHKLKQYFAGTPNYFAGFLKGSELASAFASADVFFLPSKTETLGLVLMEAMAAGCAVVTPRAGGTSDIVQDRVTGHLYDPKEGPLEVIRKLLFDSDHREAMRRRARTDAEQWNWTAATKQLEGFYNDLLTREQRLPEQVAQLRARGADSDHICESLEISKATLRRHKGARSPAYV
jgi:glycosyltransferase involved in cell wall biosynthesis